jgi:phage terminase large subunit
MTTETIDLGYRPRAQFVPFHARRQRWACIVAHRRSGKTVACVMDLIDAALRCQRPDGRFAYIAPTYTQAKDVALIYLKRYTANIPGVEQRESDLSVILPNGARIRLYGSETYDRLRGIFLDGCVLDEFGDMFPQTWTEVIRPALADRKGWATFIGTPKGRNAFYDIHRNAQEDPAWFSMTLRASETGILPPSELADLRATLTPNAYDQELEVSFDAAILGAYYAAEIADAEAEGRITDVPYDPAVPVHTAWDLGIGDATAIWFFQVIGQELHVIDHYEASGQALAHYAAVLSAKPYRYGIEWLPHDGMARELGTGRTRFETLRQLTNRHPRLVRKHTVDDGINAGRLSLNRAWIDADSCRDGLEALRQYRADYDEKAKVFHNRPKHDWTSHSADAAAYMALAWQGMQPAKPPAPPRDSWDAAFSRAERETEGWRVA